MHVDLTSTSVQDQQAVVQRALDLGGRHHDAGQRGDEGHVVLADPEEETAVQSPHGGPRITRGCPPVRRKTGKTRFHLDLAPSPGSDQQEEVERLLADGATRVDIGQGAVPWAVLADPDGNELCVLPSGT